MMFLLRFGVISLILIDMKGLTQIIIVLSPFFSHSSSFGFNQFNRFKCEFAAK